MMDDEAKKKKRRRKEERDDEKNEAMGRACLTPPWLASKKTRKKTPCLCALPIGEGALGGWGVRSISEGVLVYVM